MKVLLATAPYETNVRNLAGLAIYLREQGAEIHWYASNKYARYFDELDIPFFPYRLANDIRGRQLEDVWVERKQISGNLQRIKFDLDHILVNQTVEYFLDLRVIKKGFDFQVLVCDQEFTALPLIREVMKVPVVAIGLAPLTENSADTYRTGMGISPGKSFVSRIKRTLWNYYADHFLFGRFVGQYKRILREYDIELAGTNVYDGLLKSANIFIQPGTNGFEYKRRTLGDNICFTGILPQNTAGSDSWYDIRLTTYRKVVFVSPGLKESEASGTIESVLQAFSGSDTLVVVASGGYATESLRHRYKNNNIIIRDQVALSDILPYCTTLISDGDFTTVLGGLSYGVPVVTVGCDHWRADVGARMSYFKLGVHIRVQCPAPADFKAAVDRIQANSLYRQNCHDLAAALLEADAGKLIAGHIRTLVSSVDTRIPVKHLYIQNQKQ